MELIFCCVKERYDLMVNIIKEDLDNDMYEDKVLDEDDIEELDLSKEKDDYER